MSGPVEKRHPNRLIHETSPYLLQHAYNPVDWYPWGPEALRLAKEQNRPILLRLAIPPATGAMSWSGNRSKASRSRH